MMDIYIERAKELGINPELFLPFSPRDPNCNNYDTLESCTATPKNDPEKPEIQRTDVCRSDEFAELVLSIKTEENTVEEDLKVPVPLKIENSSPRGCSSIKADAKVKSSKYNLRNPQPIKKAKRSLPLKLKRSKDSFRDLYLEHVDVDTYHHYNDETSRKILELSKRSFKAQIDKFVYDSKSFVVISWLNAARIFEYEPSQAKYIEVKRIPERYVSLNPQIITCLHHSDSEFYLGYMWGNKNGSNEDIFKPYIERRDIYGKLLGEPYYYDHVLESIHSDKNFVYVQTKANSIHIHRKALFDCIHYHIDLAPILSSPLIGTWIDLPCFEGYTRLPLVVASTREIILTRYDALEHRIIHSYQFNDNLDIISIDKVDRLIIITRTSEVQSSIDFGFINRVGESQDYLFVHEASLTLNKCRVIQTKYHKENLYIFGRLSNDKYELGCLYIPTLNPLWNVSLKDVDESCHILPHDTHVMVVKSNQQLMVLTQKKSLKHNSNSIFSKFEIRTNKYLQTLGAHILKKLQ